MKIRARMSDERRKVLADLANETARLEATGLRVWDDAAKQRLVDAYKRGGRAAAQEAFPEKRKTQVHAAIKRYCLQPVTARPGVVVGRSDQGEARGSRGSTRAACWQNPEFTRRFMEALTDRQW